MPDGIGAVLRARRMSAGLSSTALAKAIGIRRETLQRIERGDGLPSTRVMFAIAKALDFEVKEMVCQSACKRAPF
ncbi:MAG: helix-turn-helix transcriptional regulator [Ramlibacter sp.]|nr:helix-turn-helix transcriptional regulator [Cryobacterium sp.]